ncbi:DL-endopeptidase inhibitor IseA family protein [Anaerotignum sp.]
MKKKVFAIFACMLLVLSVGCSKDPAPETPDTDNPAVETELPKSLTAEETKQLYTDAMEIYADISMANFDVDTEKSIIQDENKYYYKIEDERFESYDDFYRYLNQYFTKDCIEKENLIDEWLFAEGKDGYLYLLAAGRGTDLFYAGYSMGEPVMTEDSITVEVTAYYTDEPYEGEAFTEAPEEPIDFETEVYPFKLVPEDGTWKFDNFKLFY